ncbi:MAG: RelA/SpoT domain-containing protein [Candidatus Saccharimonadales bacterium]
MISNSQVNKAGDNLRQYSQDTPEYKKALTLVEDWRRSHIYPLKTIKSNLDKRLLKYPKAISAQRLKRMPTILDKITRRQPTMRLSAMQDIGGVRAIMATVSQAEKLAIDYRDSKRFAHILRKCNDYIIDPKDDGYRGIHLVYEYNNTLARTDEAKNSKGILVEIQIRSELQHIWATAVETVGLMTGKSLKTHEGGDRWLEFFKYLSSVFAIIEGRNVLDVHKGLQKREVYEQLLLLAVEMNVFDKLRGYSAGIKFISDNKKNNHYHLLVLDTVDKRVQIRGYGEAEYEQAVWDYEAIEAKQESNLDAVLVSVGHRRKLEKAYPNYYLDVEKLLGILDAIAVEYTGNK